MKKRFFLAAVLFIGIMLSVSVNSVNAAAIWYPQCVVGGAGAYGGVGLVQLSGGTLNLPANYYALGTNTTEANQGMATALTALSTGATVTVLVDPNVGFWPVVLGILAAPAQ